jgi:hypothetical protein
LAEATDADGIGSRHFNASGDDLRLVGKIRNRFAHDLSASFADRQISSWCEALRWHRETYMTPPPGASARDLLHVGVNRMASYLHGYVAG